MTPFDAEPLAPTGLTDAHGTPLEEGDHLYHPDAGHFRLAGGELYAAKTGEWAAPATQEIIDQRRLMRTDSGRTIAVYNATGNEFFAFHRVATARPPFGAGLSSEIVTAAGRLVQRLGEGYEEFILYSPSGNILARRRYARPVALPDDVPGAAA